MIEIRNNEVEAEEETDVAIVEFKRPSLDKNTVHLYVDDVCVLALTVRGDGSDRHYCFHDKRLARIGFDTIASIDS